MPKMRFRLDRTISHLRRYRHIMAVLVKYGFEEAADAIRHKPAGRLAGKSGRPDRKITSRHSRPKRLRLALEEMGPTFVKFGQLLSTRPDLLGPDYIQELEQLQDRVKPVPFAALEPRLAQELDKPLNVLFKHIDVAPIAAGSIAQVHKAVTADGRVVALKILRPNVEETLRTECEILSNIAHLIKGALSEEETIDPQRMVAEFTEAVQREVDLDNELRNLQRFARNFQQDPTVHVPWALEGYCTRGVLTMEFIDGIKPTRREALLAAGLDPQTIARRGADFILRQVFDFGIFHTDPHPGNLLVMPDNVVVPLDFGQVARLSRTARHLTAELVLAIVDHDAERLVHAFETHDLLDEQTDASAFAQDIEELLDVYHSLPLSEIPFGRMMSQTFEVIRHNRIRPPPEFTMMLKSVMTIESLAKGLSPDFQLIEQLRPYARKLSIERYLPSRLHRRARRALRDISELANRMPGDLAAILAKFKRGELQVHVQHEHLQQLTQTLHMSANRVSFSLIIAGLLIASSMLVSQQGHVMGWASLQTLGVLGYLVAAVLGLWLVISIIRGRHV